MAKQNTIADQAANLIALILKDWNGDGRVSHATVAAARKLRDVLKREGKAK